MASRGRVPEGTDGSDHKHRQTIESRYSVIARAQKWVRVAAVAQLLFAAARGAASFAGVDGLAGDSPVSLHVPVAVALLLFALDRSGLLARNNAAALWTFVVASGVQGALLLFSGVLAPAPAEGEGPDARRAWTLAAAASTAWAAASATGCAVGMRIIRATGAPRPKKRS